MTRWITGAAVASLLLLPACVVGDDDDVEQDAATQMGTTAQYPNTTQMPGQAGTTGQQPQGDMRLEVDISERQLHVYRAGQRVASHPVAVGSSEWPTPTGEWSIGQVVWNPRWIPPQEAWAKDEKVAEPGAADNPLGRAQLVYSAPNSVHGTNDPASLGKAVSHGSIRVSNDVAMELARQVMEAGGAAKDENWYRQARDNRTQRQDVNIPNPVPIKVVQ